MELTRLIFSQDETIVMLKHTVCSCIICEDSASYLCVLIIPAFITDPKVHSTLTDFKLTFDTNYTIR